MSIRLFIDLDGPDLFDEKLRSCVSRYFIALVPSSLVVHCWTSPSGCTAAFGISGIVCTGSGIAKPCVTSFPSSIPTCAGLSCADLWFPLAIMVCISSNFVSGSSSRVNTYGIPCDSTDDSSWKFG